jgi:hypothetical protein
MLKFILILSVCSLLFADLLAQRQVFNLSVSNLQKLNKASTGHERLLKYYRYFRRDSLKHNRMLLRKYRRSIDSAVRVQKKFFVFEKGAIAIADKANRSLRLNLRDSLSNVPGVTWRALHDSVYNDSLYNAVRANWQQKLEGHEVQVLSMRGQKMEHFSDPVTPFVQDSRFNPAERKDSTGLIKYINPYSAGRKMPAIRYPQELKNIQNAGADPATRIQAIKSEGVVSSNRVLKMSENDRLSQTLISESRLCLRKSLLKFDKFSGDFVNQKTVKTNSLKSKEFKERLHIAFNVVPVSFRPFACELAPQLGYKLTRSLLFGCGLNYKIALKDTITGRAFVSPAQLSYRTFSSVNLFRSVFASGELRFSNSMDGIETASRKNWSRDLFAGVGKRFLIHPKFYFTTIILYRLNAEDQANPSGRFQMRAGLEFSELALRRTKPLYHPNR